MEINESKTGLQFLTARNASQTAALDVAPMSPPLASIEILLRLYNKHDPKSEELGNLFICHLRWKFSEVLSTLKRMAVSPDS